MPITDMAYQGLETVEDALVEATRQTFGIYAYDDMPVKPQTGPQSTIFTSEAYISIIGGAAGGGKTYSLLMEPLKHARIHGFTAVIFRRTYPQITNPGGLKATSEEIFDLIPGMRFQEGPPPRWIFPSGFVLPFHHMQHEKNRFDWKGTQLAYLGFDQLEEFTEKQFWYMFSRNRSLCGVPPYIRASCNPVPPDDPVGGWLNRLLSWWIDQETGYAIPERSGVIRWFQRVEDELVWADRRKDLPDPDKARSLTFIPALLEDNPILDRDANYRSTLEVMPRVDRERLLGGNWKIRDTAGTIFDRAWFQIVDAAPAEAKRVRYWDKAATEGGGKFTAGVKMSVSDRKYYIEDVVRGQWSSGNRNRVIKQTTELDGIETAVWVEQEPGSGGKESAEYTIKQLAGYKVHAETATGSKVDRAEPLAAQAEVGNVVLVRGEWNEAFLSELHNFEPKCTFSDQVDAASGAFNKLALGTETSIGGAMVDL